MFPTRPPTDALWGDPPHAPRHGAGPLGSPGIHFRLPSASHPTRPQMFSGGDPSIDSPTEHFDKSRYSGQAQYRLGAGRTGHAPRHIGIELASRLDFQLGQAVSIYCGLHDTLQISGYSSCLAGGEPERGHYYDEADGYAYSVDLHLTGL